MARTGKRRSLARRRVELRKRGYNIRGERDVETIPLTIVYEDMPHCWIKEKPNLTIEARQQADILFEKIKAVKSLKPSKLKEKQEFWRCLFYALNRASCEGGCVAYHRGYHKTKLIFLQVVDAAWIAGLIHNVVSKKGSPKVSRLLPSPQLEQHFSSDPWQFDADRMHQYVFLIDRETKQEIPFDLNDPTPNRIQKRLENINAVNDQFEITFRPYDEWTDKNFGELRLRPVHYARFTDDWQHHGRIYTGKYGHQHLRSRERQWISFNGSPSVELDYSAMHPRMLYHLKGIDYQIDPYQLDGENTPPNLRLLAKTTLNVAINNRDRKDAISACNEKLNEKTADGEWETGKAAREAKMLSQSLDETGRTFADLYDELLEYHEPISDQFCSDAGMELMNLDGQIALDILEHFTSRGVPCLSVHDSFIVPERNFEELKDAMTRYYHSKLGYFPVIK